MEANKVSYERRLSEDAKSEPKWVSWTRILKPPLFCRYAGCGSTSRTYGASDLKMVMWLAIFVTFIVVICKNKYFLDFFKFKSTKKAGGGKKTS